MHYNSCSELLFFVDKYLRFLLLIFFILVISCVRLLILKTSSNFEFNGPVIVKVEHDILFEMINHKFSKTFDIDYERDLAVYISFKGFIINFGDGIELQLHVNRQVVIEYI